MDCEQNIGRIVRIGTVTAVNGSSVRVKYADVNMTSGWLPVLQHTGAPVITAEGTCYTGTWMPKINDTVLVLYIPVFNSNGFVLGAIT